MFEAVMLAAAIFCVPFDDFPADAPKENVVYSTLEEGRNDYSNIELSEEDMYWLEVCIQTETGTTCTVENKMNVCCVILNRYLTGWKDSVKEVILQPHQFAHYKTNIDEKTKTAIRRTLEEGDVTGGCRYFHSKEKPDSIKFYGKYMFTDSCGHHFFK